MPQLLDHRGRPLTVSQRQANRRVLKASYDAAQTTDENKNHWAWADGYNANASNDPETRKVIRERARLEAANNCYAAGTLDTLSNDIVGTGPRLQLSIPGVSREQSRAVERLWSLWAEQVRFANDLRINVKTKKRDGELIGLMVTNRNLDPFLPQLALKFYEPEQLSTPNLFRYAYDPRQQDGVRFDEYGNPTEYHLLKFHPGSDFGWMNQFQHETFSSAQILHWFRADRPGQARGISELMPALPLFAQLRRFTLAVIAAAENGANIAGVLETDQSADGENSTGGVAPFDRVEIERAALMTLPGKWKMHGFDSTQPQSTYDMFVTRLLIEIGRAMNTPYEVISGDSSRSNYSSSRLMYSIYHRSVRVERRSLESAVLRKVFFAWLREAFAMGILPQGLPPIVRWVVSWYWDGFDSIDPFKEANANSVLLESNQTTLAELYAEAGQDWEEQLEQRALELRRMAELGISQDQSMPNAPLTPQQLADAQQQLEDAANA